MLEQGNKPVSPMAQASAVSTGPLLLPTWSLSRGVGVGGVMDFQAYKPFVFSTITLRQILSLNFTGQGHIISVLVFLSLCHPTVQPTEGVSILMMISLIMIYKSSAFERIRESSSTYHLALGNIYLQFRYKPKMTLCFLSSYQASCKTPLVCTSKRHQQLRTAFQSSLHHVMLTSGEAP